MMFPAHKEHESVVSKRVRNVCKHIAIIDGNLRPEFISNLLKALESRNLCQGLLQSLAHGEYNDFDKKSSSSFSVFC